MHPICTWKFELMGLDCAERGQKAKPRLSEGLTQGPRTLCRDTERLGSKRRRPYDIIFNRCRAGVYGGRNGR
jgi:hypothetical protein